MQWTLKAHTHEAIHDHVDRIFNRLPVGMRYWIEKKKWNVHV